MAKGSHKLTQKAIQKILNLYKEGRIVKSIAKEFGLDRTSVTYQIKKYQNGGKVKTYKKSFSMRVKKFIPSMYKVKLGKSYEGILRDSQVKRGENLWYNKHSYPNKKTVVELSGKVMFRNG